MFDREVCVLAAKETYCSHQGHACAGAFTLIARRCINVHALGHPHVLSAIQKEKQEEWTFTVTLRSVERISGQAKRSEQCWCTAGRPTRMQRWCHSLLESPSLQSASCTCHALHSHSITTDHQHSNTWCTDRLSMIYIHGQYEHFTRVHRPANKIKMTKLKRENKSRS